MEKDFSLNSEDGTVECHICGKHLASNASLIDHHRTHTGERPYACPVCTKRFTQKAHLIIHKRTHTGEKPYSCLICHKRFSQSSHLKNHKRIHTGEKAYLCSICNMGFSRKPRLEQHLEEHILHEALVAKSKKGAAEREVKKAVAAVKTEKRDKDSSVSTKELSQTKCGNSTKLTVSRKRKPAFVTRVRQSDSDMSHFEEDDNDIDNKQEIICERDSEVHVKTEPVDNYQDCCSDEQLNHQMEFHQPKPSVSTSEEYTDVEDIHVHVSTPSTCDVSSSQQPASCTMEDLTSAASDSNNSSSDLAGCAAKFSPNDRLLLHSGTVLKNRSPRRSVVAKPKFATAGCSPSVVDTAPYCRPNKRICLLDFSAEDLITHLMSRDDVLRCDYCCVVFQDPAMYHLHRSMHDKSDIRCCNTCGKLSHDKYDFTAHYLCEHK